MMKVIITGANRGIGLALAKELVNKGFEVIALCRSTSLELEELGVVIFQNIDVTDSASLQTVADRLEEKSIDLLINNAGILEDDSLENMNYDSIIKQFETNAVGALKTSVILLSLLKPGGKIIMISSRMGSLADNASGGHYGYRASKAALNMLGKCLAIDFKSQKITVAIIHPGFVNTAMVSYRGDIEPEKAAKGIVKKALEIELKDSGTFWHANGEKLPW